MIEVEIINEDGSSQTCWMTEEAAAELFKNYKELGLILDSVEVSLNE